MSRNQSISEAYAPRTRTSRSDRAIDSMTDEEKAAWRTRYKEESVAAKDMGTMGTNSLQTKLRFEQDMYKWYKQVYKGERRQLDQAGPDSDGGLWVLDANDLMEALKAYILHRVLHTEGRHGTGKPTLKSVNFWKLNIIWLIGERVGDRGKVESLLYGKLFNKSDGVVWQLSQYVGQLQVRYNLQRYGKSRQYYGRPELLLFLVEINKRKTISFNAIMQLMQQEIVLKVSFFTGCRPGALMQTRQRDGYMRLGDVIIRQTSRFDWIITFDLRNIKGFRAAGSERQATMSFTITPVSKVKNVIFDLSVTFIPFCISRGILYDNHNMRHVNDIIEFFESHSTMFTLRDKDCTDDGPLFLAGKPGISGLSGEKKPLLTGNMNDQLREVALAIGLETGSLYGFRHDVGDETHAAQSAEAARHMLGHGLKNDTLRQHYSRSTGHANVTSTRLQEYAAEDPRAIALRNSLRSVYEGIGPAVQAVMKCIQDVSASAPDAESDGDSDTPAHSSSKGKSAANKKKATKTESAEEKKRINKIRDADPEAVRIAKLNEALLKELEELVGVKKGGKGLQTYLEYHKAKWARKDSKKAAQIGSLGDRLVRSKSDYQKRRSVAARSERYRIKKEKKVASHATSGGSTTSSAAPVTHCGTVEQQESARQLLCIEQEVEDHGEVAQVLNDDMMKSSASILFDLFKHASGAGEAMERLLQGKEGKEPIASEDAEELEEFTPTKLFIDINETEDDSIVQFAGSSVKEVRLRVMIRNAYANLVPFRFNAYFDIIKRHGDCIFCGKTAGKGYSNQVRHLRKMHPEAYARMATGYPVPKKELIPDAFAPFEGLGRASEIFEENIKDKLPGWECNEEEFRTLDALVGEMQSWKCFEEELLALDALVEEMQSGKCFEEELLALYDLVEEIQSWGITEKENLALDALVEEVKDYEVTEEQLSSIRAAVQ